MKELKKYKKAWTTWEEWYKSSFVAQTLRVSQGGALWNPCLNGGPITILYGLLLEFLDEQGLLIDVSPDMPKNKDAFFFSMKIVDRMLNHLCIWMLFQTRQEAQHAAVNEAFELLEKRLEV